MASGATPPRHVSAREPGIGRLPECAACTARLLHHPAIRSLRRKLSATSSTKAVTMRALIAMAVIASSIAGCAVYTPSGSVVIDPAGRHDSGDGKFCPPGQAKKGNC